MRRVSEYKWFLVFFAVFFSFQVLQSLQFSWDPLVYLYNGKWFCGEHIYFEWLRPPLPGAVDCLLGAGPLAVPLSVAVSCLLYFVSVLAVFRSERLDARSAMIFSAFSFLFPLLFPVFTKGGDLFALSFLMLAMSSGSAPAKGVLFGLASLSRYNFLFFFPAVLYGLRAGKWPVFLASLLLVWSPWLLFNLQEAGDPFFSVSDSVFLNVQQKGIVPGAEPWPAMLLFAFLASAFLNRRGIMGRYNIAGFICSVQFLLSGIKEARFLNALVVPQALNFSGAGISGRAGAALVGLLVVFSVLAGASSLAVQSKMPGIPDAGLLGGCRVMSDGWLYFYPHGIVAEPLPGKASFGEALSRGDVLVVYDRETYRFSDANAWDSLLASYEHQDAGGYFVIMPNSCEVPRANYALKVWRGDWKADNDA